MTCTCRECLELAARGADVELLRCVAQDPLSPNGSAGTSTPGEAEKVPQIATSCCHNGILRIQTVPFGMDALSASQSDDPDERAYLWELCNG